MALIVGYLAVKNQPGGRVLDKGLREALRKVDFLGSLVLVVAISAQLVGLSVGGNELPWSSPWVIGCLVGSTVLFALFLFVEAKTSATPIIPLRMLRGRLPIATQIANVCAGLSAYGVSPAPRGTICRTLTDLTQFLFNLPLFFQVVLKDSPSIAGARLAIPSMATPIGSVLAGVIMSRWGRLIPLVRLGAALMLFGNAIVTSLGFRDSTWKYFTYIFPANLGQGVIYPSILFTSLASFEHSGESH